MSSDSVNELRDSLESILEGYIKAKKNPLKNSNPIWKHIMGFEKNLKESDPVKSYPYLRISRVFGSGQWKCIPAFLIIDPNKSPSAKKGIYCSFDFREDMSGCYLALSQGIDAIEKDIKTVQSNEKVIEEMVRKILHQKAMSIQKKCTGFELTGFALNSQIDLKNSEGTRKEARKIMSGTIAHKLYSRGQVPNDSEIEEDLAVLLKFYASAHVPLL